MAFTLKEGQGSFFKNEKDGVEGRPDYRGDLNIGGKTYALSGWIKTSAKGTRWMSLKASSSVSFFERIR